MQVIEVVHGDTEGRHAQQHQCLIEEDLQACEPGREQRGDHEHGVANGHRFRRQFKARQRGQSRRAQAGQQMLHAHFALQRRGQGLLPMELPVDEEIDSHQRDYGKDFRSRGVRASEYARN